MSIAVYRLIRTLDAAGLDVLATLAAVVRAEGLDPRVALDLAAFELKVRAAAAPGAPPARTGSLLLAGRPVSTAALAGSAPAATRAPTASQPAARPTPAASTRPPNAPGPAGREARAVPKPTTPPVAAAKRDKPDTARTAPLTKPCEGCGKVRTARTPSGLRKLAAVCPSCNGRRNLDRAWKGAAAKREAHKAADPEPEPAGNQLPLPAAPAVPTRHPWRGFLEPRPKEAGPAPEKIARRFKCERLGCGKEFIAEAERGKHVSYCEACRAEVSPVVAEDRIVGDGTGGLEAGKVYQRKVLAPAGWRERQEAGSAL
ncbi:MAG: hypothetical protein FJZ01_14835 [Candidatus Sericytochromatia bacterium]|nr:hypothetical protein [Candidatus Tanganyikabacteria bacterium]